ncbi:MAG: acyl-CoA thioesterase [Chitinophagaceae bacterium]|nr:MAG: acyl-CoA thioesterase [Chitinophagaceae bacterium]
MPDFEKEPESKVRIRFPDCDPFRHLNNSRYIDYMINAREDQLMEYYGFDPYRLAREQGLGWVAAQTQIAYLAPALPLELVTVKTRLLSASDKSLLLEAQMLNEENTVLKSVLWTRLVHFNIRSGKSEAHAPELQEFLRSIEAPPEKPMSFEERVSYLRSSQNQPV